MLNPLLPDVDPKNTLTKVYLGELHWHCTIITDRWSAVDQLLTSSVPNRYGLGPDGYMLIQPALLALLTEIILAASNIKKLIKPATERGGTTTAANDYLIQRARYMSDMMVGLSISEIYNAKTRNALEHFDGELDKYCRKVLREKSAPHKLGLLNVILSNRNSLRRVEIGGQKIQLDDILFLRAYIVDTTTFIAFGEEVNIGQIYSEAKSIQERLNEVLGDNAQDGRLLVLPQV